MLTGCVTAALLCTAPVLAQQPTSRPATWRTTWPAPWPGNGGKEYLTPLRTLTAHTWLVRCLAYAPNGLLASGGKDRRICIWSTKGKLVRRVDLRPSGG